MACAILYDPDLERAVFFDTVTERPVNHPAFVGPNARDQAEAFLEWNDHDPRAYPLDGVTLDSMISLWEAELELQHER